jgi:hypothetical protein
VQTRPARRQVIAMKAAIGAADPTKDIAMATDRNNRDFEQPNTSSPTDRVLTELQLYGHRPYQDEPDPRPLPDADAIGGAVADIFDALVATLNDTRLEPDLEDLLWSTVNLFHRAIDRLERHLDDNEQAQRRGQKEQDGSEVRSVELERLTGQGLTLIERRNAVEVFRDQAADQFERHTGSTWRPRSGSMVNHRTLTAALIDSREAARRSGLALHQGRRHLGVVFPPCHPWSTARNDENSRAPLTRGAIASGSVAWVQLTQKTFVIFLSGCLPEIGVEPARPEFRSARVSGNAKRRCLDSYAATPRRSRRR